MEIRPLFLKDVEQGKELWLDAFPEDADGFCDYYFSHIFPQDKYYGLFIGGKLQSMAGLAIRTMNFLGVPIEAGFFRGVATKREQRGNGYSGLVIKHMLNVMNDQGLSLAALKTYIHAFYRKFGFETCSNRFMREIKLRGKKNGFKQYYTLAQVSEEILKQLLDCYSEYIKNKDFFLYRNSVYFQQILGEILDLYQGVLIVHYDEKQNMDAYMIAHADQEKQSLYADELVCIHHQTPSLFAGISTNFPFKKIIYKVFDEKKEEDGMIRILNMSNLLKKISTKIKRGCADISIQDEILSQNSGQWRINYKGDRTPEKVNLTPGEAAVWLLKQERRLTGIFEEY